MGRLYNRNVLLGITGGIAAYKSAQLVRDLREAGATVRVVMTHGATEFITPLTLQALSGHPVHQELLDAEAEAGMGHIELARWADLVLVAPATADFISRLAHGRADDLLTTLCLATAAPLLVAPAMNQGMWRDPATGANIELLASRGIHISGPGEGSQACGCPGSVRLRSARRPPGDGHGGADPGGHRPGALYQQPQFRKDGFRHRQSRGGGRRCHYPDQRTGEPANTGKCEQNRSRERS